MKNKSNNENGSALAMVLIIMVVLMILGTALLSISLAENKFSIKNEDKLQAYYIARSGAQSVAEYLVKGENAALVLNKSSEEETLITGGKYQVTVSYPIAGNTKVVDVTSIGTFKDVSQTSIIRLEETNVGLGMFEHTIFAYDGVGMSSGNSVNNVAIVGSISSNGPITVNSSSGGYTVNGSYPNQSYPFVPINKPATTPISAITTDVTLVAGSNVHIETPYINMNNSDTITVNGTGAANLYITGASGSTNINSSIKGSITIAANAQLNIFLLNNTTIDLSGSPNITGKIFIYAPYGTIELGSATNLDLRGIIIAKNILVHNQFQITYDESVINNITSIDFSNIGITHRGYTWIK
jgi:hypothetical protein